MAFIKNKTDLFSEISATKALFDNFPELNKTINSYESVKSKSGNLIPLFLDLLQELIGTVIEEKFKEFIKKADNIELKIKDVIIKEVMKKVVTSGLITDDSCDFTSAGTVTLTERIIQPDQFQVNLELCKTPFESTLRVTPVSPFSEKSSE